jgi:hypothetical protein
MKSFHASTAAFSVLMKMKVVRNTRGQQKVGKMMTTEHEKLRVQILVFSEQDIMM